LHQRVGPSGHEENGHFLIQVWKRSWGQKGLKASL
jgi:hypothetical protein